MRLKEGGSLTDRTFDRDATLGKLSGNAVLLRTLIRIFLNEIPAWQSQLGDAVQRQDAKAIRAAAHQLRGPVSNFVARDLANSLLDLEKLATAGRLEETRAAFARVESDLTALVREFAQLASQAI